MKKLFLDILSEKYGIDEEDFPLGRDRGRARRRRTRDGLRPLDDLGATGQDDRVCAYTSLAAQLDVPEVTRTAVTLLVDKEEIGSVGASGMTSRFFENAIAEIMELAGESGELKLRRALANSRMLSSDVSAGLRLCRL